MEAKDIHKFYEEFTGIISGNPYFEVSFNKNKTLINNFLNALDKHYSGLDSLGVNFFWGYFAFQYNYWIDKYMREPVPPLHLIIGDKARERWYKNQSSKNFNTYFVENNLLIKYPELKLSHFKKIFGENIVKEEKIDFSYQERQRELFLNTPRGFVNCFYNTNLYSNQSKFCIKCNSKSFCIKLKSES